MPLQIPPELKKITQYIRRAEELDKDSSPQTRIVSYYLRQHAVQIGIPLSTTSTPATRQCLQEILTILENEKKVMKQFTQEESYTICREFAFKVFDKADSVDRRGMSDKSNAKNFYAAASFLDVLTFFHKGNNANGDNEEMNENALEEDKMRFYAKWKATDILNAIKEGREIKPGGFGEDIQQDDDDDTGKEKGGKEEEEHVPPPPPPSSSAENIETQEEIEVSLPPPPAYTDIEPIKPPPASMAPPKLNQDKPSPKVGFMKGMFGGNNRNNNNSKNGKYTKAVLGDAKELTNFALKALNEKDGDLAIERLQQALEVLMNSQE
jgi:vacuolar protein sorting-associated protein VTA1